MDKILSLTIKQQQCSILQIVPNSSYEYPNIVIRNYVIVKLWEIYIKEW
jgi:hypothetical protein